MNLRLFVLGLCMTLGACTISYGECINLPASEINSKLDAYENKKEQFKQTPHQLYNDITGILNDLATKVDNMCTHGGLETKQRRLKEWIAQERTFIKDTMDKAKN